MPLPKNPVRAAREKLGLDLAQAAIKCGVGYQVFQRLERGYPADIAESWRPRLEALGIEFASLRDEYRAYRAALAAQPIAAEG